VINHPLVLEGKKKGRKGKKKKGAIPICNSPKKKEKRGGGGGGGGGGFFFWGGGGGGGVFWGVGGVGERSALSFSPSLLGKRKKKRERVFPHLCDGGSKTSTSEEKRKTFPLLSMHGRKKKKKMKHCLTPPPRGEYESWRESHRFSFHKGREKKKKGDHARYVFRKKGIIRA